MSKALSILKAIGNAFTYIVLPRIILLISIPLILINVFCAIVILIKNWSLKHTKELNV